METRKRNRFIYYIFENNLKSIHNKDYSVVKTFKAASSDVVFCIPYFLPTKTPSKLNIEQHNKTA